MLLQRRCLIQQMVLEWWYLRMPLDYLTLRGGEVQSEFKEKGYRNLWL